MYFKKIYNILYVYNIICNSTNDLFVVYFAATVNHTNGLTADSALANKHITQVLLFNIY